MTPRRPASPQRVVPSLAQLLVRWRYVILVPIALVYFSTLAILTNRQNLDVATQPNLYAQKRKYAEARISRSECTFCKGEKGIPNLDLVVPQAGGKTCRSIQLMAASEMEGSDMCAILQKEERACCPRSYSPTKTIFVISLQGTPGAHESNQGRLDLFKEKWRMSCGSSFDSTNIEHCPAVFDKRRGYGLTLTWILCLWRARQLDEEVAIFLEDDARLFENSTQEFCDIDNRGELLSKLPSDTFVAWLGGHTWSYEDSAVPYRRVINSYGTYGFVVPRNSMDDFYAALKHGLINGSKDRKQNVHHNSLDPEPNFYRAAREHHKKIYAFNPLVVWHEGGYSNTWGKTRGNITGLETQKQGIKVSSGGGGMSNTNKRSVTKSRDGVDDSSTGGGTTKCEFCEDEGRGGTPNLDLEVPNTGGNTCGSIKKMAAREVNGSTICATLKKEERVCCPGKDTKVVSSNAAVVPGGSFYYPSKRLNHDRPVHMKVRVLLFVTTHMSAPHAWLLKSCWPTALRNSLLLDTADVAVYLNSDQEGQEEDMSLLRETFKHQNLSIHVRDNPGYQQGAIAAMSDATREGWFKGYDWVIRVNPDVIIRDDTFILDVMHNDPKATGLLINCLHSSVLIHTDFFGIKPEVLRSDAFLYPVFDNAERAFTHEIRDGILKKGGARWIPGAQPQPVDRINICRAGHGRSIEDAHVIHFHPAKEMMNDSTCPIPFNKGNKRSWNPFLKHIAHNPVQNNAEDRHYLLKNTSLWASGGDAKKPLKAYPYQIPLVQWTEEAERHISERWHNVQHRSSCDRAVWFQPWYWGITGQVRDYIDLAIISVFTFDRTIIPQPLDPSHTWKWHPIHQKNQSRILKWCSDAQWLDCFFQPLQGHQCDDLQPEGRETRTLTDLGSSIPFYRLGYLTKGSALLHDHTLFPNEMWDTLIRNNEIVFQDPEAPHAIIDAKLLKHDFTELYYELSLSALRAILARVVLQVRPKILAKAKALIQSISSSPEKPVFAVHFRRTDKKLDRGITNSLSLTGVSFVNQALARFAQITKSNNINGTLLVLSDDPRAIDELRQDLGSSYTIQGLSDVQTFFREGKDYLRYLKEGHTYMEEQEMFDKDPRAVYGYYESVIVDAVAAGLRADYLIGMGCSGVSQLIAQWIGGRERTEGNALSLWQEDLSPPPAPEISWQTKAREKTLPPPPPLVVSHEEQCSFCEGEGISNLDLEVPNTGGNTCGSIKKMAAREVNGSAICATLKKEESMCCPSGPVHRNTLTDADIEFRFLNQPVSFHAATSKTIVDDRHEYVLKVISKSRYWKGKYPLEREICILKKLSPFPWAPRLVWYNSSSMVTSFEGKPLDLFNIPLNYREQYANILRDLTSAGVTHGDIHKQCKIYTVPLCKEAMNRLGKTAEWYELTVHEVSGRKTGKYPSMSLLDFSWAKFKGSYSCNRHIPDKGPDSNVDFKFQDDAVILEKLDMTFRRHLQLEQHLMVDWTNHFPEEKIKALVKRWPNLLIRKVIQHQKYPDDSTRVQVLSKFYNMEVDDFRGKREFNIYFFTDTDPTYDFRPSSKGNRIVNVAMFDLKRSLRDSMGGGFKIHATDNIQETKDNLKALGLDNEYQHRQFDTLRRVFDALNVAGCKYVVLRNFEKMPDEVIVDPFHLDVDLLVSDYYEVKRILDGSTPQSVVPMSYENGKYRIQNTVSIGGEGVNFDLRFVGDNYLDKQWQQDIIKRRVSFRTGIYVPSEEDHLYTIIYHAIIQKKAISNTYVKTMTSIGNFSVAQAQDKAFLRGELDSFMTRHNYTMVRPIDKTVGYFYEDSSSHAPEISWQTKAREKTLPPPPPLVVSHEEQCSFCEGEGGIPNLDLEVPNTGGNTCGSIKKMAAREVNGSTICATLKKEESACCPVVHKKSSSLQVLRNYWNGHRLADGVKGYDRKISNKNDACGRWPGSILCEYLKRTEQKKDISTLADIVRRWNISEWGDVDKPSANTTVVHLRLGDGLCGRYDQARLNCRTDNPGKRSCWDNDADCFKSTNGLLYAYPKEYYEPVAQDLLKFLGNKTSIIIVADPSHWGRNKDMRNGDYSIDYAYRDNVVSFFRSKGFVTQVRENSGRPDDDFIYMSSAQNFVRGGGDFSKYIAEVVTANGGRVFEPRILSKDT